MNPRVDDLVAELALAAHPEGGFFRRIYESATRTADGTRPVLTAIRFLLARGQTSSWHRVDADECWHWQQGGALELLTWDEADPRLLVQRLDASERGGEAMIVVPAGVWQAARPLDEYGLVTCTVSPGFVWEGFQMLELDSALGRQLSGIGAWQD